MATAETPDPLYEMRSSPIHGTGLFAVKEIQPGTRIVEYLGEKITKAESNRRGLKRMEEAQEKGEGSVYIFELNKRHDIDGKVPYNDARFINHSCSPNCEAQNIRGHIWVIALKRMRPGVELSLDYGYALEHFLDHPCHCGASNCAGYIVHKDDRRKLRRILARKKPKGGKE